MTRPVAFAAVMTIAAAAACGPAAAHIVLSEPTAKAGGYYAGFLRLSHGCAGAATTALTVTIPDGVLSAKPQPKSGWTIDISRTPLATPFRGEGGGMVTERVTSITWRGSLPDDEFDQFGLMMKLPAAEGPLYFPTVQTCGGIQVRWDQIPAPGQAWGAAPHPAPVLTLTPAAGDAMAGMHH